MGWVYSNLFFQCLTRQMVICHDLLLTLPMAKAGGFLFHPDLTFPMAKARGFSVHRLLPLLYEDLHNLLERIGFDVSHRTICINYANRRRPSVKIFFAAFTSLL